MPISGDQWLDPNDPDFGLPKDSCVGNAGPSPEEVMAISGPARIPYAGAKTLGSFRTIVSGPDLPNDQDTDDPNRS